MINAITIAINILLYLKYIYIYISICNIDVCMQVYIKFVFVFDDQYCFITCRKMCQTYAPSLNSKRIIFCIIGIKVENKLATRIVE